MAESVARVARYEIELNDPLVNLNVPGLLVQNDKLADTVVLAVTKGGQAATLTGATAFGEFERPVDGAKIRCAGTVSGGTITIPLLDQCYKYAGSFVLIIRCNDGSRERSLMRLSGYVERGGDGVIIDPSGSIPSYGDLEQAIANCNAAAAAATAAKNELLQAKADGEFTGPQGPQGPTGPQGATGPQGETGATPNLTMGTVTTGAPGTQASASFSGTAEEPMLNLVIPRGADGSGSVSTVDGVQPASGDVPLGAVRYSEAQSLTDGQKTQARGNIGAAKDAPMTGAAADAAGAAGLVPAPAAGDEKKALLGDGTWGNVASTGVHVGDTAPTDEDANVWIDPSETASGYRAAARNLLDNSDFTDPVNQRGGTSGAITAWTYFIDRWQATDAALTYSIGADGIHLTAGEAWMAQNVQSSEAKAGRTYTFAVGLSDGTFTLCTGALPAGETSWTEFAGGNDDNCYVRMAKITGAVISCSFKPKKAVVATWAALYEGTYTADTLPPYVPKGYAAELAECMRYAIVLPNQMRIRAATISNNTLEVFVPLPMLMRSGGSPSLQGADFAVVTMAGDVQSGFTFSVISVGTNGFTMRATKTSHGLSDADIRTTASTVVSRDL